MMYNQLIRKAKARNEIPIIKEAKMWTGVSGKVMVVHKH